MAFKYYQEWNKDYKDYVKKTLQPTPQFNVPMARKVVEYAEAEHDDFIFDMGEWIGRRVQKDGAHGTVCKTAACLAGTAVFLSPDHTLMYHSDTEECSAMVYRNTDAKGSRTDKYGDTYWEPWRDVEEEGQNVLGLTEDQAGILFFLCDEATGASYAIHNLKEMIRLAELKESADA